MTASLHAALHGPTFLHPIQGQSQPRVRSQVTYAIVSIGLIQDPLVGVLAPNVLRDLGCYYLNST